MGINIREIALQTAIDDYFSKSPSAEVWDRIQESTLIRRMKSGEYNIWEPFEYYEEKDVIEFVESLAQSVEAAIKYVSKG